MPEQVPGSQKNTHTHTPHTIFAAIQVNHLLTLLLFSEELPPKQSNKHSSSNRSEKQRKIERYRSLTIFFLQFSSLLKFTLYFAFFLGGGRSQEEEEEEEALAIKRHCRLPVPTDAELSRVSSLFQGHAQALRDSLVHCSVLPSQKPNCIHLQRSIYFSFFSPLLVHSFPSRTSLRLVVLFFNYFITITFFNSSMHAVDDLSSSMKRALAKQGIDSIYSHQLETREQLKEGKDVIITTPTSR